MISFSHHAYDFMQGLEGARSAPWGIILPKDAVKQEANRVHNEAMQVSK
jgi:hypothetical protein